MAGWKYGQCCCRNFLFVGKAPAPAHYTLHSTLHFFCAADVLLWILISTSHKWPWANTHRPTFLAMHGTKMGQRTPPPKECTQAVLSEVPKRFLIKYPSQFYNTNSIEIDFFGRSTNRVRSEVPKAFDAKYQPDSKEPTLDQKWHPFGYHKGTHFGRLFAVVFASIVSGREQKSTPGHKKCKVKCKA